MFHVGSCLVSGWGYSRSGAGSTADKLMAANVTILTHEDCQQRFNHKSVYPGMLCAGGEDTDACQVN